MQINYDISGITSMNLTQENLLNKLNISPLFDFRDYDIIKIMVKTLEFMKISAKNIRLISKDHYGDSDCKQWDIDILFIFNSLDKITMKNEIRNTNCLARLSRLKKITFDDGYEDYVKKEMERKRAVKNKFVFNIFCFFVNIFMTNYIIKIGTEVYKYHWLKKEKNEKLKWIKRYKRSPYAKVKINFFLCFFRMLLCS